MNVCGNCFNDFEIKSHIGAFSQSTGKCNFCGHDNVPVLDIDELMDFFIELLGLFRNDPTGIPLVEFLQEDWNLFSSKEVASKILSVIMVDNDLFLSHQKPEIYVKYIPEIDEVISHWDYLKESLKWERRFILETDNLIDLGWDRYFAETISLSDESRFFRARIHFDENSNTFCHKEMGSPPREKSSEGRANPLGIPYLYLSKDIKTTFFETKVLLHDEVSIGEFAVKKEAKLDFVDFTEIPSAFVGMGDLENYSRKTLLKKRIGKDLSKPIRRYDSKIEYVPTQFICEFLRYVIGADGIIFKSSLYPEGQNIVLFNEEMVECIDVKKYVVSEMDISFQVAQNT
ncbi:MAG: RES domain-containing protein [bacterium]